MTAWRAFLWALTLDRTADMVWTTTLAWMATQAPNATVQGLLIAGAMVPNLAVTLFGGVLADRHGSAAMVKMTTVGKAGLLLVLLAFEVGNPSLLVLALVAAGLGACDGFHDPAMLSWGARMRSRNEQAAASATEATLERLAQTVGAALGGMLLGVGAVAAVSVAMAAMVVQRVFLHVMGRREGFAERISEQGPEPTSSMLDSIGQGLRFLRTERALWATMSVQFVVTISIGATLSMLVPLIIREQGWSPVTFGIGSGLFGAGLMLGSGWVMHRQRIGRAVSEVGRVPFVGFACAGGVQLVALLIAVAPETLGPAGLCFTLGVFGLLVGPVSPLFRGFRRERTPDHQQGVMAATALLLIGGLEPLGPLLAGVLVALTSSEGALSTFALVSAVVAGVAALGARAAERSSPER